MSAIMKIIKEKYQIFNQNAITFMQTLESECIDLIIADPPYFRIKGDFDFVWANEADYITWNRKWLLEAKRILKNNGTLILWGGDDQNL